MAKKWIQLNTEEMDDVMVALKIYNDEPAEKLIAKLEKAQKRITISSAKAKGRNLQYWVCEKISKLLNIPYKQGDDQCDIQSRPMGQHGIDVILRGEALRRFPFSIECKASEGLNLVETVEQVKANLTSGTDWLIIHNRKAIPDTLVIMSWDTFEKLYKGKV